ncbi:hypothetical protein [Sphingobium sp.]|uniref:hypothetical protein n=1 Tax=Sphingobium sp. TaxID=1912891 RepID=UPI003B3B5894
MAEYVWDVLAPHYGDGDILPHPDDDLTRDAHIDPDEVEDMVADVFSRFALPQPTVRHPESVPEAMTIPAFARYLDGRRNALRNQIAPPAS